MKKKPNKTKGAHSSLIVANKKARHDYHFLEEFEAGLMLAGWEAKSLRAGKAQLVDSYVLIKDGEGWLVGANITPLPQASTHVVAEPRRDRKLLMHKKELAKLFSRTQSKGITCIAVKLYWKAHRVKCKIALAQGKKEYDKRQTSKERDWNIEKQRIMQKSVR